MTIRRLIDLEISRQKGDLVGNIASPIHQLYTASSTGNWTWAADVDIGTENVLRSVPIDPGAQTEVLRWGYTGTGVILRKVMLDRYVIIGIAPKKLSVKHILYVDMEEYVGKVVNSQFQGMTVRLLTFEEIGEYGGGWGQCPFGAYASFDADGEFIALIY